MKTNQDYRGELEKLLVDNFTHFFPNGTSENIRRETFQSKTFQNTGFNTMPEKYGPGDGFLYTVVEGRKETFVVTGKISSENPFEVMHASHLGTLDLREKMTVVYQYDGKNTITETDLKTKEKNQY